MFAFSTFVNLYSTFLLQSLWNWYKPEFQDEQRWKWLEIVRYKLLTNSQQTFDKHACGLGIR
jgi:hypothetical protein